MADTKEKETEQSPLERCGASQEKLLPEDLLM
jgi:hypothetical protein